MKASADRPGDFGARLRDARERKGISLREIANQTKISMAVLEALERNDISRLPGGIFGRAFVRSYATAVGLDAESVIMDFIARFPQESVTAGHPTTERPDDDGALDSSRRVAGALLWILAIAIPLAGILLYFSMASRTPPAMEVPVSASTSPSTFPAAPPAPAAVPPADASATSAPAGVAPDTPAPTAETAQSAERLTVGLSARRPVWVSATADGRKAIERLLQTGDQETLEIAREMILTAGDASALRVTLNGVETRPLGKTGEVVTTRLNLSNFKDYLQAR